MPKLFRNICDGFTPYNPEDDFTHLKDGETFDENGLLHSYNDLPSQVFVDPEEYDARTFLWHSHGTLYRENNKPVVIIYDKTSYSTLNEDMVYHSFNENPSRISYNEYEDMLFVSYYENDGLHRENGLPAQLFFTKAGCEEVKFYENNKLHRLNDLPASYDGSEDKKEWAINAYRHRENGPAITYPVTSPNIDKWILFDVRISETQFTAIKKSQKEKDIPLWLAFLYVLKIVEEVNVNFFIENNLHNELPLEWNLRNLGVTDEVFKQAIIELRKTQVKVYESEKTLTALIDITRFYEQKKEINA
jgi:hypothetical protein